MGSGSNLDLALMGTPTLRTLSPLLLPTLTSLLVMIRDALKGKTQINDKKKTIQQLSITLKKSNNNQRRVVL